MKREHRLMQFAQKSDGFSAVWMITALELTEGCLYTRSVMSDRRHVGPSARRQLAALPLTFPLTVDWETHKPRTGTRS